MTDEHKTVMVAGYKAEGQRELAMLERGQEGRLENPLRFAALQTLKAARMFVEGAKLEGTLNREQHHKAVHSLLGLLTEVSEQLVAKPDRVDG